MRPASICHKKVGSALNAGVLFLFVTGLILIIKGGDLFVEAAAAVARVAGMTELVIGATIVTLGTTMPEIMVSTTAGLHGAADIAVGNALGSIICNTALIAGLVILIAAPRLHRPELGWRAAMFCLSAALLGCLGLFRGGVGRPAGALLLLLFALYALLSMRSGSTAGSSGSAAGAGVGRELLVLLVSGGMMFFGAHSLVENGSRIALYLGVSERVIGSTLIALGTSLPELVTAITALRRGMAGLSVGNVVGANITNVLLVIGIPALLSGMAISPAALLIDLPIAVLVMLLLLLPPLLTGKTYRIQGALLLTIYAGYVILVA